MLLFLTRLFYLSACLIFYFCVLAAMLSYVLFAIVMMVVNKTINLQLKTHLT